MYFEKAYCHYRLNDPEEALRIIESVSEMTNQLTELKAQVFYRMEKYKECYSLYREIIKKTNDEYEDERQANMCAVMAFLNMNEASIFLKEFRF